MFFSIITPCYKAEKYLRQCVDSLLCQTFQDFEILLVDDGSPDETGALCDALAVESQQVLVFHKENGGAASARNYGIARASGEYIIFIDADDYISSKDFLQQIADKAASGADIIAYKFQKFDNETGRVTPCSFQMPVAIGTIDKAAILKKMVENDAFYCAPWAKAVKADIIKNHGQFEDGLMCEDQHWYYSVVNAAKRIDAIDEAFIMYRQDSASTSHSWKMKNLTDCISILEHWASYYRGCYGDPEAEVLLNSVAKLYCNLLIGYTNFADKNKKSYYSELKELSFLLQYNLNPRVAAFYKLYKIAGFHFTMFCLNIVCKVR